MAYSGRQHLAIRALQYGGRSDVTQDAIAAEMGVARGSVSNWMTGRRPWPNELSIVLLDYFKISAETISLARCVTETEAAERDALGPPL